MVIETSKQEAKCKFVKERICHCNILVEKIPLEVYRLCVEARKIKAKHITIHRRTPTPTTPSQESNEEIENLKAKLRALDRCFMEEKIELEDFLNERKKIVNKLMEMEIPRPWEELLKQRIKNLPNQLSSTS